MDGQWMLKVFLFIILRQGFGIVSTCSYYKELTTREGDLHSPGYPAYNPQKTRCQWLIRVQTGYVITLHFDAFDMGQSDECSNLEKRKTFLEVRDAANKSLGTYCGSKKPMDLRSRGNELWVEYITNGYRSTMFSVRYQVTNEPLFGPIVAMVIAAISGTIICIVAIIILIRRKHRNCDDELDSHVSPSRDLINNLNRTCSLVQDKELNSIGHVNKAMDDNKSRYCDEKNCHLGNNLRYSKINQLVMSHHDNCYNGNQSGGVMTTIDVDSKHSEHHLSTDRLSSLTVMTSQRKPSESESIITTAKVIFVQDSSSSRSGSSSGTE